MRARPPSVGEYSGNLPLCVHMKDIDPFPTEPVAEGESNENSLERHHHSSRPGMPDVMPAYPTGGGFAVLGIDDEVKFIEMHGPEGVTKLRLKLSPNCRLSAA